MKEQLNYTEYRRICLNMAQQAKQYKPVEVVAVMRGGMSAAHIIAKELNLPCGAYFPDLREFKSARDSFSGTILFIDDLVAEGRTYEDLREYYHKYMPKATVIFGAVLVDKKYKGCEPHIIGFKSSDWIVFPYEDYEKVAEGDRGLFRHGTDKYNRG